MLEISQQNPAALWLRAAFLLVYYEDSEFAPRNRGRDLILASNRVDHDMQESIGRFSRWSQSGGKLFFLGTTEDEKAKELCNIPLLGGSVTRRSISSCNGLLCIAPTDEDDDSETPPIVVCNPITKEHTFLPKTEDGQEGFWNKVGIGFDASTNKYKVARIYYLTMNDNESRWFCEIITIGEEKSWRKIDLPFNVIPLEESGGAVFWEGALHWICMGEWGALFILRFDISKEEFQLIEAPFNCSACACSGVKFQLLELGGSLIVEELIWQHPTIRGQYGTIRVYRFRKSVTTGEIRADRISVFGESLPKNPKFSPDIIPCKRFSLHYNIEENWKIPYKLVNVASDEEYIPYKLLSAASNEEYWKVSPNKILCWFPGEERYAHQEVQGIPKSFIPSGFRPTLVSIYSTNSLT
ncbi:hypothetical protein Tsubulata_002954 [Turnera subulata]|uniref:F-box associated beta-propeller type 3 domain-containing protein n=1 Tax=Turnera subulata TaxID=218843 RepID=A0A9Q0FZ34_9ROSI|nr:hypothetical protein Tsubulata_002954 [Turnera subulata]